jgi:hypothetical protein
MSRKRIEQVGKLAGMAAPVARKGRRGSARELYAPSTVETRIKKHKIVREHNAPVFDRLF